MESLTADIGTAELNVQTNDTDLLCYSALEGLWTQRDVLNHSVLV